MVKKNYPDWVEKHHAKGTAIKQIRDNYYLYAVTSHYSKDKPYPVSEQRYIGKITESGLVEPRKITFLPGMDKLVLLKDAVKLDMCSQKDYDLICTIPVLKTGNHLYTGKITGKQKTVIGKYMKYEDGEILV